MNITSRMNNLLNSATVRAIDVDCFAQKATASAAQALIAAGLLVVGSNGRASITDAGRAALTVPAVVVAVAPVRIARRATEANKVATVTAPKGKLFTSTVTLAGGSTRTVTRAKPYAFAVLNTDGTVARWTNA
jgi:hypothetical protein